MGAWQGRAALVATLLAALLLAGPASGPPGLAAAAEEEGEAAEEGPDPSAGGGGGGPAAAAVALAEAPAPSLPPPPLPPAARCRFSITGGGPDRPWLITSATISCEQTGAASQRPLMSYNKTALAKFADSFEGVPLDDRGCGRIDCLVTFCGSGSVALLNATIRYVHLPGAEAVVCVSGDARVTFEGGVLADNHATNGTIQLRNQARVDVRHAIVARNDAMRGAGAMLRHNSTLVSVGSPWQYNFAVAGAAVQVADASTIWVLNGTAMRHNMCYSWDKNPGGGAIFCRDEGRMLVRYNTIFANNTVQGYDSAGGAIFLQGDCKLDVRANTTFYNNTVLEDNAAGGAISSAGAATLLFDGSTRFVNNSVRGDNCGGGALFVRDEAVVAIMRGATFTGNLAIGDVGQGGGIYASNDAQLLVGDGVVFDSNAVHGVNSQGGALTARQNTELLVRGPVSFVRNTAAFGAALALVGDMAAEVSNATVSDNVVLSEGGGIYLEGSFDVLLKNVLISNNSASQGGGLMATGSTAVALSNFTLTLSGATHVLNNNASTGGGMAVASGTTTLGAGVVIAGNNASQGGGIAAFQGCRACNATVMLDPGAVVANNSALLAGGGIYLDSAAVHLDEEAARAVAGNNTAAFGSDISLVSRCIPGEVRTGAWCIKCGANTFSFNPANTSCDLCPPDASCPGGASLEPLPGFWHSSNWSTQIHRCPNAAACTQPELANDDRGSGGGGDAQSQPTAAPPSGGKGGGTRALLAARPAGAPPRRSRRRILQQQQEQQQQLQAPPHAGDLAKRAGPALGADMSWQCGVGYEGNLCGSCSADHGLLAPFRCGRCMALRAAVALYVLAFAALALVVWATAHVAWLDNRDGSSDNADLRVSDVVKIVVVYIQCVIILVGVPVPWPNSIAQMAKAATWLFAAGSSQLLSLDCLFREAGEAAVPRAVLRQLIYLAAPAAMFAVVVALQAAARAVHGLVARRQRRRLPDGGVAASLRARLPITALTVLTFFFPSLVRVSLSMFACYPLDGPGGLYPTFSTASAKRGYWQYDMDQACWQGWHRKWALALGLPFTIIFCAGVPLGFALLMHANRSRLDEPGFRRKCGTLYRLYRPSRYAWEAVVASQLVLLVLVSVFGPNIGAYHEGLALSFLFSTFLLALLLSQPYRYGRLRRLAVMAWTCLGATAYAALSFMPGAKPAGDRAYREAVGALALALNIAFLLWAAYTVLTLMRGLLQRMRAARASRGRSGRGPRESKDAFGVDPAVGNPRAPSASSAPPNAAMAGAAAGAAAAKALAAQHVVAAGKAV